MGDWGQNLYDKPLVDRALAGFIHPQNRSSWELDRRSAQSADTMLRKSPQMPPGETKRECSGRADVRALPPFFLESKPLEFGSNWEAFGGSQYSRDWTDLYCHIEVNLIFWASTLFN